MRPEDWQRIVELFERVRAAPPDEQERMLAELEREDPDLVAEVRRLLASKPPTEFVTPPPAASTERGTADSLFGGGLQGTRVGDFVLRAELGRGGMGVVYLAEQESLGRTVAVKVLPLAQFGRGQSLERFRREAKACSTLHHPQIASVLAYGEGDSTAWYAMRFVDGHDLSVEIDEQRALRAGDDAKVLLPPFGDSAYASVVVERIAELAGAVQHAHEMGIVHRDIKPQNIIVDANGHMHLVDFGLARDERFGTLSATGEIRGTAYYMSPEQVRAARDTVDHRTDIYSLGLVLYELLCLERAHEGRTSEEVLLEIVRRPAKPLRVRNPRVARDLAVICEKCIAKSVELRYRSAGELADDLLRFLRHEAIVARPPTLRERAVQFVGRHRRATSVTAAVVVAAPLGSSLALWFVHDAELARRPLVAIPFAVDAASGERLDGEVRVSVRALDAVRDAALDEVDLGSVPLDATRLEAGRYRFVVRSGGFAPAELTRTLAPESGTLELVPRLSPEDRAFAGMRRLEAGSLTLAEKRPIGCLYADPGATSFAVDGFWIDEAEVTNGQYLAFLDASGRPVPDYWSRAGYVSSWRDLPVDGYEERWSDLPVVGVSWFDAQAFAEWSGKRLVMHVELERASAGTSSDSTPVRAAGPNDEELANVGGPVAAFRGTWRELYRVYVENVRPARDPRFRHASSGLFHAYGNVDEFTESVFVEPFRDEVTVFPAKRIYFGGAWDADPDDPDGVRAHTQIGPDASYASNHIGFRCARSDDL